ncbi:hypothetical protein E4O00_12775 [Treponema sp. OMZ 788]|uniref:hypothetical protein n=1 Tax=Treponema sp. OMZ 788 TaxID=2563664 RepID=UPI0020A2ACDE|nr:hypothetical protein [Treponema sp. OMZ 788]UTC64607.1 hypothetical protein E4O00_12775 [Treponema sp. OMZ 788]
MENIIQYSKENEEYFFKRIEELTDKNQFLACIETLESIPKEKRDYRICYELARAYQNFAIIGENEKGTEIELGRELLLTSISILESVREEGENKAKWNMRMAYGYQYLEDKEEFAIPYALHWAELDPSDKDAMAVVEECKQALKNRVKKAVLSKVYEIVVEILKSHKITDSLDYSNRENEELEEIDEEIYLAIKDYAVEEEDILDVIENVLEDLESVNKYKNGGKIMEKITHDFFWRIRLGKGTGR